MSLVWEKPAPVPKDLAPDHPHDAEAPTVTAASQVYHPDVQESDVQSHDALVEHPPSPPSLNLPEAEPVVPEYPVHTTRSGRTLRVPKRYQDFMPTMPLPLAHLPAAVSSPAASPSPPPPTEVAESSDGSAPPSTTYTTEPNQFGLFCKYPRAPFNDPDQRLELGDLCDPGPLRAQVPAKNNLPQAKDKPYYYPFSSPTAAVRMVSHYDTTVLKSARDLVADSHALGALGKELSYQDLLDLNVERENALLDKYLKSAPEAGEDVLPVLSPVRLNKFLAKDGWREASVFIPLPADGVRQGESDAPKFEVPGVWVRDIVDIVSNVYQSERGRTLHTTPFEEYWDPGGGAPIERVYSEVYSSASMLEAQREVEALNIPGPKGALP
ncbi:hypothetical protein BC834DRAFT_970690 [Gloeopeniophorella convolvens]|nr:hypothetical protein BC834DRAFT_970690 [Gloeopeniophorella convolvens]